jgi:hypothetical protein
LMALYPVWKQQKRLSSIWTPERIG